MEFLSRDQIAFYRENGYLALPAHLPGDIVEKANREIDRLSRHAAGITGSDDLIDLEDTHTPETPRIRRIKRPDLQSTFFDTLMRGGLILGPARNLIGPNIRMHTTKLNMKKAGYGAEVKWHQDFAFYPHTNDDVLAVGVVFDDMGLENGPLQVLPGTHVRSSRKWRVRGRHRSCRGRSRFCRCRPAHRSGGNRDDPSRPHRARFGAQHVESRPPDVVLRDDGRGRFPGYGFDDPVRHYRGL